MDARDGNYNSQMQEKLPIAIISPHGGLARRRERTWQAFTAVTAYLLSPLSA